MKTSTARTKQKTAESDRTLGHAAKPPASARQSLQGVDRTLRTTHRPHRAPNLNGSSSKPPQLTLGELRRSYGKLQRNSGRL